MPSRQPQLSATTPDAAGPVELLLRSQAPGQLAHRLKEFLEHLPVGIFIADRHGSLVYHNRAAAELIGPVPTATARGDPVAPCLYRAGTDTPYPDAEFPVSRALAGDASVVDDLEVEHARRGRVRLRAWGAPLLDAEGEVALAVVAFADVTVEKLLDSLFDQQVRVLERERIAEGIHDDVLQLLAAARLHLGSLRPRAREEAASAEAAKTLMSEAVLRLRLLLAGLKPRGADGLPLGEALGLSLAPLAAAGVNVRVEDNLRSELREPASSTLRSVCEEAIANIRKHARPKRIGVTLGHHDGGVAASVVDDGLGFELGSPPEAGHLGLILMEERVSRIGGRFRLDTSPGRGTAVHVWVPDPPVE
jgi:signal transduction histidine kinase